MERCDTSNPMLHTWNHPSHTCRRQTQYTIPRRPTSRSTRSQSQQHKIARNHISRRISRQRSRTHWSSRTNRSVSTTCRKNDHRKRCPKNTHPIHPNRSRDTAICRPNRTTSIYAQRNTSRASYHRSRRTVDNMGSPKSTINPQENLNATLHQP